MRCPLTSPCHVGSADAAPSRAGLSPDPSSRRIHPTMAGSARVGRRSAAGCAASSPPTRRQPSPPRLQPCRTGSADVAPAAARQWRWRSTSRRQPCRARSAQCRHHLPPRPLAALISEEIGSGYVVGYGVDVQHWYIYTLKVE
uniref:Uncharacterized protein n=1 Tax=Oryza glaberrima TaxID=4538 RepID=I1PIY8_ORYGL